MESYYVELYMRREVEINNIVEANITALVIEQQNLVSTSVPNEEEIYKAISSMNTSSSPGPDSFGGGLYKTCWGIIRSDLVTSIQYFFIHGYMPNSFNHIHLCLIPKTNSVDRVELYRLIAVADFHFKNITKIIAERLNPVATQSVSPP